MNLISSLLTLINDQKIRYKKFVIYINITTFSLKHKVTIIKTNKKLRTDSILYVPLTDYGEDFTFIVNNEEFLTNKFSADLLSKMHLTDPTLSQYCINAGNKRNFQNFLDLLTFKTKDIEQKNLSFICELIEELSIENVDINVPTAKVSKENVIDLIESHSKFKYFYSKELKEEIDFLSGHLYELNED